MIVVRIRPDSSFEVVDREKEMVRPGAGGLDGRALTPEARHTALQVMSKFRRLADSRGVEETVAVATSAVREAENCEFLQSIAEHTGIRPRVIPGTEEARLIHLAAAYGLGMRRSSRVITAARSRSSGTKGFRRSRASSSGSCAASRPSFVSRKAWIAATRSRSRASTCTIGATMRWCRSGRRGTPSSSTGRPRGAVRASDRQGAPRPSQQNTP